MAYPSIFIFLSLNVDALPTCTTMFAIPTATNAPTGLPSLVSPVFTADKTCASAM
jgi:hypothetical protein